jgi:2-keto-4-pentenoate hydratase/2-oxohepta-3-ene-1,7-dioic acid hydratase in catechol pathway
MNLFYVSQFFTENRDIIFTGTPAGCCRKTGRHIGGILEGQNYLEYR